ncbi:hypothetical protein GF318_04480 [Candidatus Micrarchaeota archaeon]|nr:hypothetical protein [Candidatus Micrarchaeota archaeon]
MAVAVRGETRENSIESASVSVLEEKDAERVQQEVEEKIQKSLEFPEGPSLVEDEMTEKLWPKIAGTAARIIIAKKLGKEILLRFHGDADGISGAFAITDVLRAKAFQQNSAVYSVRDALRDISTIGQEGKAVVILLDFASNNASLEAISLLKAAGLEVLIIDHHPPGDRNNGEMLNPAAYSPEGSKYPAGYLACEIAIACGMEKDMARKLAGIACAGDKSPLFGMEKEDVEKAMVLDFLAAHISYGNNLSFYRKVMKNESLFSSIARQAEESIDEATQKALAKEKTDEGAVRIISFPLEGIVKKGEWPPAGKITTSVFEKEKDGPLVCIGHTERSLILRISTGAVDMGLSANELAGGIMESMPDFVEGGGGHAKAGAIRTRAGFAKDVLNELIRRIKEKRKV